MEEKHVNQEELEAMWDEVLEYDYNGNIGAKEIAAHWFANYTEKHFVAYGYQELAWLGQCVNCRCECPLQAIGKQEEKRECPAYRTREKECWDEFYRLIANYEGERGIYGQETSS